MATPSTSYVTACRAALRRSGSAPSRRAVEHDAHHGGPRIAGAPAQVERADGRAAHRVPPLTAAQQAGAELLSAFGRRADARYPEVEMGLLRTILVGLAGRPVAGGPLQADPPAVTGVERDPLIAAGTRRRPANCS